MKTYVVQIHLFSTNSDYLSPITWTLKAHSLGSLLWSVSGQLGDGNIYSDHIPVFFEDAPICPVCQQDGENERALIGQGESERSLSYGNIFFMRTVTTRNTWMMRPNGSTFLSLLKHHIGSINTTENVIFSRPLPASATVVGGKFFTSHVQNTFIVSKREKTHITRTRINVKTSTMNISLILIAIRTSSSRGELKGLANLLFKKYIETKNQ